MRKIWVSWLLGVLCINYALAEQLYFDCYGNNVDIVESIQDNYIKVPDFITVGPENLIISESVYIENDGNITADKITVCDRCVVKIENSGVIDSEFVLGDGAQIVQIVSDANNMNAVNFGVDYTVHVQGTDSVLSLADVVDFAPDADKVFLENVRIEIDRIPNEKSRKIELGENVVFVIKDVSDLYNATVLDNVVSYEDVRFESIVADDALYSNVGRVGSDGTLYIEHVRETDYDIVIDGDKGDFIDSVRGENDDLKSEIDSAPDIDSINNTLSKTALFNPDVLQDMLHVMTVMETIDFDSYPQSGAGVSVFGILSDNFYTRGADIHLFGVVNNRFNANLSLNIGQVLYESDLEDFDGAFYGANLGLGYRFNESLFVRGRAGIMKSVFDIDKVMYNDKIIEKPDALSGYVVTDMGVRLNYSDSLSVVPFVGFDVQLYDVAGVSYSEYAGRIGAGVEYKYSVSDLEYKYALGAIAETNGIVSMTGQVGFMLPLDLISGNLKISVVRMLDMFSYKASIDAKILF